jgi:hypothetical protein
VQEQISHRIALIASGHPVVQDAGQLVIVCANEPIRRLSRGDFGAEIVRGNRAVCGFVLWIKAHCRKLP